MTLIQIDTATATAQDLELVAGILRDLAKVRQALPALVPAPPIGEPAFLAADCTEQAKAAEVPSPPSSASPALFSPPEEPPKQPRRRRRRTKAEMAAARTASSEAPAGAPSVPASQGAVEQNTPSEPASAHPCEAEGASSGGEVLSPDDFKAQVREFGATDSGLEHVIEALNTFGYERTREVPSEQYQTVLDKCRELTKED